MLSYRNRLVELLQLAFSGERAAGYAYRGHWGSLLNREERDRIKSIEAEEWHHRKLDGEMLEQLGDVPNNHREVRPTIIGRTLQVLCYVTGWLIPMYGAGKLESRNVREYENAARYAFGCGRLEYVDCLLTMAEVEWEHEHYFREKVLSHRLGRLLPIWPEPPPKTMIRDSFKQLVESRPAEAAGRSAVRAGR